MKSNPPQDTLQRDIREWSNTSDKGQGHSQPKVKGKGKRKHPGKGNHNRDQAGSPNEETGQRTLGDFGIKRRRVEFVGDVQENDDFETPREKPDQSTGEVLFAVGCRDDRPIVDSGSVVSTCPVDSATSVPTEKVHYSMNLESVG